MKSLFTTLLALIICSGAVSAQSFTAQEEPFVVVELYTSEGCSSCPSGDNFLTSLKNTTEASGQNVLLLAEHVPYWDYLGWKDPYAYKVFENMQRAYCTRLASQVYTPMFVLNGTDIIMGSSQIRSYINSALALEGNTGIALRLLSDPQAPVLQIEYDVTGVPEGTDIAFVLLESGLLSQVTSGENAGKTLHHENVVRFIKAVSLGNTPAITSLVVPGGLDRANLTIAAYAKDRTTLEILAGTTGIDLSTVSSVDPPSIDDHRISIWPNPATTSFCVGLKDGASGNLKMFNTLGVMVLETQYSSGETIDISSLPDALYFVRIHLEHSQIQTAIVNKRTP